MRGPAKAKFVLGWLTGAVFICFGAFYLLEEMLALPDLGVIPGGVLAVTALARLVLVALPASGPSFSGGRGLEIAAAAFEALLGAAFFISALYYIDFFFYLAAGLLAILAGIRLRQGAMVRKKKKAGMGAYILIGVLLLVAVVGVVADTVWLNIGIPAELTGAAGILYGVFLLSSSFFRHEKPADTPKAEEKAEAMEAETRAEKNSP
jgi:hypothetical protein